MTRGSMMCFGDGGKGGCEFAFFCVEGEHNWEEWVVEISILRTGVVVS